MPIKIESMSAEGRDSSRGREPGGLTHRIGRISKTPPPAPKGRGIVLLLLGLAVIYALIDTFVLRGSSAGNAIEEFHSDDPGNNPPVAPGANGSPTLPGPGPGSGDPAPIPYVPPGAPATEIPPPATELVLPEGLPPLVAERLRLNLSMRSAIVETAVAYALRELPSILTEVPEEHQVAVRAVILDHVARAATVGRYRPAALEVAAWLAPGPDEPMDEAFFSLLPIALGPAWKDDASTAAAIGLLESLSDRAGGGALGALDQLIQDRNRPLHLRVAAARIRPQGGRPQAITEMADDPKVHPLLRKALDADDR